MTTATHALEVPVLEYTNSSFTKPDTSQLDRCAYLVGTPISHSQSPALHHAIYSSMGKRWGQVLAETHDLAGFIRYLKSDAKSMGSGVTMPFKVAVIPFLDELEEAGQAVGAINTIFYRNGSDGRRQYIGTNTDVLGVRDAFLNNVVGAPYKGKPGLVVGGGGTCRAVVYALRDLLGCSCVYIVNRDKAEVDAVIHEYASRGASHGLIHVASVEEAISLIPPAIIVSAVPDFQPKTAGEVVARQILETFLHRGEGSRPLLEMCYHPSPDTAISRLAASAGWQVIGGIEAMIGQGLAQASLWTGRQIDSDLREQIARKIKDMQAQRHKL
ncbi:hypothetical protein LTR70_009198 [Exophiala xenobiotica]|uniref:Shikimate dehydrogenase substrate binding N-terminal domain-containing protein n=1 Tax=Lithohypha guttulata TaxID=1690604 RepID=A0ABR0JVU6_9EURO|nr:hypothetical protein LTR24_009835 [Lithohypha guttulata]KAK5310835.1 hypothetical protein LTR70_009198 [Exophiala xenobiotica]